MIKLIGKVAMLEATNARIKHEVKDQEELLRRIGEMDGENQELLVEVSRLKEVDSKLSSLREVESRLRERLLQLEQSEERLQQRLEEEEAKRQEKDQRVEL